MSFQRISIDSSAWMKSKPEHSVFRITHYCPACKAKWAYDVTDTVEAFVCPSDAQLGPALLCGSCEARRRINYRYVNQDQKTEWQTLFFGESKMAQMWAVILKGDRIFTEIELIGPYTGQKLLDEKRELLRILTTRKIEGGRTQLVVSMTEAQFAATPQKDKWDRPKRPDMASTKGWG
jgi:hypothetical protein